MRDEEKKLSEFLDSLQLPDYQLLPDIELYKDQVLSYLARIPISHRADDEITSAMINNYIKAGLLPRSNGKKYDKEHLAYLTIISKLKMALSVNDTKVLLDAKNQNCDTQACYAKFKNVYEVVLQSIQEDLESNPSEQLADTAMQFAIISYLSKIACEYLIDCMPKIESEKKTDKKADKKADK